MTIIALCLVTFVINILR